MPSYASELTNVLSERPSSWHGACLKFMVRYIGSLLRLTTTNGKELALDLNTGVKSGSNYRRIQRFMSEFAFDFETFGRFLLSLLPGQKEGFLVVMDRTEWHFGSKPVNVLTGRVCLQRYRVSGAMEGAYCRRRGERLQR